MTKMTNERANLCVRPNTAHVRANLRVCPNPVRPNTNAQMHGEHSKGRTRRFAPTIIMLLTLIFMATTANLNAQVAQCTTGDCNWTLTGVAGNYTLAISGAGAGAMANYAGSSYQPWYSYREGITTLNIHQGVTAIGSNAFSGCSALTAVTVPNSVMSIGTNAFQNCTGLVNLVMQGGTEA